MASDNDFALLSPYDDYEVEEAVEAWASDFFGEGPFIDDPMSNYWIDPSSEHGAEWVVTYAIAYDVNDEDVIDWLDDLHPNMYRGNNNQDATDIQQACTEYFKSQGFEQLECVRVKFQRYPAGEGAELEDITFLIYVDDLATEA